MNVIKEIIIERNSNAKFLESNFDKALVGYVISNRQYVAVYDSDICLDILMKTLKIGEEEAYEQYQYVIETMPYSENNPVMLSDFRKIKKFEITEETQNIFKNR